jgi:hypothetical protein
MAQVAGGFEFNHQHHKKMISCHVKMTVLFKIKATGLSKAHRISSDLQGSA